MTGPPAARALALAVAVGVAAAAGACRRPGPEPTAGAEGAPALAGRPASGPTIDILLTYGSEKQPWIEETTAAFNRQGRRTAAGRTIVVTALPMGSGEAIDEILSGTTKAHLVSPASAAFVALGNAQSRARTGRDLVGTTESLVLSPVVIAMWRPMAEAIGWGRRPIGWSDVLALARDPRGWASVRQPQFGAFRFGHTHPEASNSGLIALVASTYAAAGKARGLTLQDVARPDVANFVAGIEKAVVHYGSSTGFFGRKMFERGPAYLSAAVLYESSVIESYDPKYSVPFPVVAIYPKEGTFWSDHPIGVVDREWVSPEHREAAQACIRFLLEPAQQALALPHGFRPASIDVPLGAPIDVAHGVDPKEPKTTLEVPPADVIEATLRLWRDNKRTAGVTLALDVSGSMNEEHGAKIAGARDGARQLVAALSDRDRFSLLLFNQDPRWVEEGAELQDARARLDASLGSTVADGGTALYDAILAAVERQEKDAANSGRISAVVVLSDGEDRDSRTSLDQLLRRIRFDGERRTVRVFTIAYGKDAKKDVLQQIAEATQARAFDGQPQTIRQVFRDISTYF
jgi:Ca-activated chloride channel family protein